MCLNCDKAFATPIKPLNAPPPPPEKKFKVGSWVWLEVAEHPVPRGTLGRITHIRLDSKYSYPYTVDWNAMSGSSPIVGWVHKEHTLSLTPPV